MAARTTIRAALPLIILALALTVPQLATTGAATATGDTYGGSGNWSITHPTVYNGTNVVVYGDITISGSGSLTVRNANLSISVSTQYEHAITISAGYLRLAYATLCALGATAGDPWVEVSAAPGANILISNSTAYGIQFEPYANGDYVDNTTMWSSTIKDLWGHGTVAQQNFSGNDFHELTTGYAIVALGINSTTAHNTIEDDCEQGYAAGYFGWITVLGSTTPGQIAGLDSRITRNTIHAAVRFAGVYAVGPLRTTIDNNTVDLVQRNWDAGTYANIRIAAGIYVWGDGQTHRGPYSTIANNTIKRASASMLEGDANGCNAAIAARPNSAHWDILDNSIWYASANGRSEPYLTMGYGILYSGNHALISRNNISWVGIAWGTGFNPAGIEVDNDYNGIWNENDAQSCAWVNTTWNTIDEAYVGTNGISYGWAADGTQVVDGVIANNTIGTVIYTSGGIGVYIHARRILVADNEITDLKMDSFGIGVCRDTTFDTFTRNYIHVSADGGYATVPDHYGAILLWDEGWANSGNGCVFSYNEITLESRYSAGGDFYPDYFVQGCYEYSAPPVFVITTNTTIRYERSSFQVTMIPEGTNGAAFEKDGSEVRYSHIGSSYIWSAVQDGGTTHHSVTVHTAPWTPGTTIDASPGSNGGTNIVAGLAMALVIGLVLMGVALGRR